MNNKCFVKEVSVLLIIALLVSSVGVLAANTGYETEMSVSGSAVPLNGGSGGGTDWWPMFRHDLQHSGYSTSDAPETNNVRWTYTTDNDGFSSPAISDGKVYIGSDDDHVYCLDADDRTMIWSCKTGDDAFSSPAVSDGNVYIGSRDDNVYCLDADDITMKWSYLTGDNVASSPAVSDGRVYVGSDDQNVYCLNTYNGKKIWSYLTEDGVTSSPAVSDGKIYFGSDKDDTANVYCLNADDGTMIWTYQTKGWVIASPAIADGKVFIGLARYLGYGGNVTCLDADDGTMIWSYETGDCVQSSPAVADGKVYVGSLDYNVYCLDADTGEKIWSYLTGDRVYSSPAVADGKVYIGSEDGKVYCFGELDPNAPSAPTITGPSDGKPGISYDFTFNAVDPDSDDVYYYIEWGDGNIEEWIGPYASDEEVTVSHKWAIGGSYIIKAQAKDTNELLGLFGTLSVTMPRGKLLPNTLVLRLLERFPNAFPIIRQMLGL